MLKQISHVAFAVVNLDRACEFYRDVMGAEIVGRKVVPEQKAEVAFVRLQGTAKLELIAPTSDDSPVGRFIAKHGPGIHHVCFEVNGIEQRLDHLSDHGVKLVDAKPRRGAEGDKIAFLHPTSTLGALIEFCEADKAKGRKRPTDAKSRNAAVREDAFRKLEAQGIKVVRDTGPESEKR